MGHGGVREVLSLCLSRPSLKLELRGRRPGGSRSANLQHVGLALPFLRNAIQNLLPPRGLPNGVPKQDSFTCMGERWENQRKETAPVTPKRCCWGGGRRKQNRAGAAVL